MIRWTICAFQAEPPLSGQHNNFMVTYRSSFPIFQICGRFQASTICPVARSCSTRSGYFKPSLPSRLSAS
jgi:hypothetical protein